jgi:hypothetical protein
VKSICGIQARADFMEYIYVQILNTYQRVHGNTL